MHHIELTIPANVLRDRLPKDKPLEERVQFAMSHVRDPKNEHDLFFMSGRVDDDLRFRVAIAGVMMGANEEERDRITRSLRPLQALSAAFAGVPVDLSALAADTDLLPLWKLWHNLNRPADEPDFLAGSKACALKPGEGECEACQ